MQIAHIGTGHASLVSGAGPSGLGYAMIYFYKAPCKGGTLKTGMVPIYQPGFDELMANNAKAGRQIFIGNSHDTLIGGDAVFLQVGALTRCDNITASGEVGPCLYQ